MTPNSVTLDAHSEGRSDRLLEGHGDGVQGIAYSPDGSKLASARPNHVVRICDLATGQLLHALIGHTDIVQGIAFSPNGQRWQAIVTIARSVCGMWQLDTLPQPQL